MRIAILGGGNMGGAIAAGAVAGGVARRDEITVSHPKQQLSELFAGMRTTRDNAAAVAGADLVVLAVKPWMAEEVAGEIREAVNPDTQSVVSVVAELCFSTLSRWLTSRGGRVPALFRVIPNTAIAIGRGVSFVAAQGAAEEQRRQVERLFGAVGRVFAVTEQEMTPCMALSSCGIAYAFRYIDAAVRGGVSLGLEERRALDIVVATVRGAVEMLERNGTSPSAETDKVTTPGGITLRGLEAMERGGFSDAVLAGLLASGKPR